MVWYSSAGISERFGTVPTYRAALNAGRPCTDTPALCTTAADCGRLLKAVGEHSSVLASAAMTGSSEVFLQEEHE